MKMMQFSISAAEATKNEARIPKASASTPPKSGPMTPPAVIALCMTPRQTPSLSGGAYIVMIARSIGQSPAAKPWKIRIPTSSSGDETTPPRK